MRVHYWIRLDIFITKSDLMEHAVFLHFRLWIPAIKCVSSSNHCFKTSFKKWFVSHLNILYCFCLTAPQWQHTLQSSSALRRSFSSSLFYCTSDIHWNFLCDCAEANHAMDWFDLGVWMDFYNLLSFVWLLLAFGASTWKETVSSYGVILLGWFSKRYGNEK